MASFMTDPINRCRNIERGPNASAGVPDQVKQSLIRVRNSLFLVQRRDI